MGNLKVYSCTIVFIVEIKSVVMGNKTGFHRASHTQMYYVIYTVIQDCELADLATVAGCVQCLKLLR